MTETVQTVQIRDLDKFTMFAPSPNSDNLRARLVWGERDGYPRITVWPNGDTREQKYPIFAGINPETWAHLVERMIEVYKGPNDTKEKFVTYKRVTGDDGKDRKETLSELWYGKNKEGICFISLTAPERPKIVFTFSLSDWHAFYNSSGEQIPSADLSSRLAVGTMNLVNEAMIRICTGLREPLGNSRGHGPVPAEMDIDLDSLNF